MDLPKEKAERILEEVEKVKRMGLSDPFEIARALDIEVVFTEIKFAPAFFNRSRIDNKTTIYISSNTNSYAKRLLCSHELGHILCEDYETDLFDHRIDPESEFIANSFAMLIDDGILDKSVRSEITVNTDVENINNFINMRVQCNRRKDFVGQRSIFELLNLNDDFWKMI